LPGSSACWTNTFAPAASSRLADQLISSMLLLLLTVSNATRRYSVWMVFFVSMASV